MVNTNLCRYLSKIRLWRCWRCLVFAMVRTWASVHHWVCFGVWDIILFLFDLLCLSTEANLRE